MESQSNELFTIWQPLMDQLNQLKQWQLQHEREVSQRQSQLIDSLSQQNTKLSALVSDEPLQLPVSSNAITHITSDIYHDSIEQMRGHDHEDDDTGYNGHNSIPGEHSFLDHSSTSYSESSPVNPGIDGNKVKTFEELLDIRLNNLKSDSSEKNNECKPKKPFLKKGEGLRRFEPNKYQSNDKLRTFAKRVCFKDKEEVDQQITKPRRLAPRKIVQKRSHKLSLDENANETKKFLRKVVPLTTKSSKSPNTRVEITRNAPTVVKGIAPKESNFLDYLLEMYENLSVSEGEDVDGLKELLNKIESKEQHIRRQSPIRETVFDDNISNDRMSDNSKKKVRWNPNTEVMSSDDSDQEISDPLIKPKAGAYSSKLKQQISELEDRLTLLKNSKKDKTSEKQVTESEESYQPITNELSKLREQIEKLNKRIVNMEAKSYDLLSGKRESSNQIHQTKCVFGKTFKTKPKTVSTNISVNETQMEKTMDFPNGDKMTVSKDNTIFYSFANGTTQTTYPDGLRITNFTNGQTERLHKNGVKHITYANGLQRIINPDTSEEVLMTDGTIWRIHSDGSEVLEFSNGDREIRTIKFKRREYRNGNIKTLYSDGTEETRYVSGRLRIKDKFGNLMVDSSVRHLNEHE